MIGISSFWNMGRFHDCITECKSYTCLSIITRWQNTSCRIFFINLWKVRCKCKAKVRCKVQQYILYYTAPPARWNPPWRGEGAYLTKRFYPSASTRARQSDVVTFDQKKRIFFMLMPRTWFKVEEYRLE